MSETHTVIYSIIYQSNDTDTHTHTAIRNQLLAVFLVEEVIKKPPFPPGRNHVTGRGVVVEEGWGWWGGGGCNGTSLWPGCATADCQANFIQGGRVHSVRRSIISAVISPLPF